MYIQLQPETDAEKLKNELSKIQFGNGFLKLEKRNVLPSEHLKPEDIDPYTIFMGNIHPSTSIQSVKQSVLKAYRVDVGFAKKHKFGRYAFAKFRSAMDARQAFITLRQASSNGGMDLVVRFRRLRGSIMTNGSHNKSDGSVKDVSNRPVIDKKSPDDHHDKIENKIDNRKDPKKDEVLKTNPTSSTSIEFIASNLPANDILDWDKLPMYASGSSDSMGGDLDELFNQLYSDVTSVFTDDYDFC